MATRPDSLPKAVWSKLDDKGKVHAAKVWPKMPATSDDEVSQADIIEDKDYAHAATMILAVETSDEASKESDAGLQKPADPTTMPTDVVSWIKAEKAKVTPELSEFVHGTVKLQIENDERKILLFVKIEEAGLDVPASDSKPDPEANSIALKLGDVYFVPGKSLDSDPVKRHRLHDLADQLFGNGYLAEFNKLDGMGDDAKKEYGENKYQEDIALARKQLSILRRKFSEAADAVVAFRACNAKSGIDVVVGNTKSPKPFMLRERMLDKDGKVILDKDGVPKFGRSASIALADLEAYRPSEAQKLLDSGDLKRAGSETEPGTMYDAILKSKPPKKKRQPKGSQQQTGAPSNDVRINNINQWESGSADMAAMVEETGTLGDWLKRANDPDKAAGDAFLLSEFKVHKFHDRVFSMNDGALLKRAAALLEAEAVKQAADKAEAEKKAA